MEFNDMTDFKKLQNIKTPAYVVDKELLVNNLILLQQVQHESGCKILLAQKGFSMHYFYPLIGEYLQGVTSSSLFEARLGAQYMEKEVHVYAPAYQEEEFADIIKYCDHIVFNSFDQFKKYKKQVMESDKKIECGIRMNPEYSELEVALYDPCAPFSRLGTPEKSFRGDELDGIDGLHFHTMCEQNSDTLERTIEVIEAKFGKYFHQMKWINFGGGHHITRADYDVKKLIEIVKYIMNKYQVMVYIEPGEAIALNCGYLVTKVLDVVHNNMDIAIIDASAACHMPDVLEMPYRPEIVSAGNVGEKQYTYRLGGTTCLAGDIVGDYSFDKPLNIGDKLIFKDMAHYTMVKTNMFNGVNLTLIATIENGDVNIIKEFGYEDYLNRLS
jgi:carboxynorspermidine decarboxylase